MLKKNIDVKVDHNRVNLTAVNMNCITNVRADYVQKNCQPNSLKSHYPHYMFTGYAEKMKTAEKKERKKKT